MSCIHCQTPAEVRCSCGEFLCSEAQSSHFLRGHSAVPVQIYEAYYAKETEIKDVPQVCSLCEENPCALLCTCVFPWLFFCRKCAEKHVAEAEKVRHGLEPLAALQFLRRKSDKRVYIERQLLLDEVSESLKANVEGVIHAKSEFLAQFQKLVNGLEAWRDQCLQEFDALAVAEDVQWAVERLEAQRFLKDAKAECGLDTVLACSRLEDVQSFLTAVNFQVFMEPLMRLLPTCFKVESRLKALRFSPKEFSEYSAKPPTTIPIQDIHSTDVYEQLVQINDHLAATLRLISPTASVHRIIQGESVDAKCKEEASLASHLTNEVFSTFKVTFTDFREKLAEILREMGATEQVTDLANGDFSVYLQRFKEITIEAVNNMSSISHALKSMEVVERLEEERNKAQAECRNLQETLEHQTQEKDEIFKKVQESLPLQRDNNDLREMNKKLSEELEKLRLSLALGLGESVKEIMESAKTRIQLSEKATFSTLEACEQNVASWNTDITENLMRQKAIISSRWAAFFNTPSLESVCDHLRQADNQVLESAQASFTAVKESINHNFRKLQLELEAAWDKVVKESSGLIENYRRVLEKAKELPSFGMFAGTLETEITESKSAVSEASAAIQKSTEDILETHSAIAIIVESLQRGITKKKELPMVLSRLQELLTQLLGHVTKTREVKDKFQISLSASFMSFEEASRDQGFWKVAECKEFMEKKTEELTQASKELVRFFERLKSSQSTSAGSYLNLSTSHYDTIPNALQTHKAAFSSLIDSTFAPLVSAILQTQHQTEKEIDSITSITSTEQERFAHQMSVRRKQVSADFEALRKPFPDDITVKPVILSETMTSLISANEGLHEEVGFLTRGLSDSTSTVQAQELRLAAGAVEKLIQMRTAAVLAQWIGRAAEEKKPREVNVKEKLPDITFQVTDVTPANEPPEVLQALIAESAFERKSTLLKQYLPERFSAVPLSSGDLWRILDARMLEFLSTPTGDMLSSDQLISEMRKPDVEQLVAALSLLASRGQPKALLFMRILGLEEGARIAPRDFALVVKYTKLFRGLAEQYAKASTLPWKKAEMYQISRGGEAWLDDVLTKFAHQFSGEVWYAFLKYLKPAAVSDLQFLLFLLNWKFCTQNLRKEAPPLWPDASVLILRVHELSSTLLGMLEGWLPASSVQSALAELGPMGYVSKATLDACISRSAYMSMVKDERFVVRGDVFILGILEAHFAIQRINARKLAETYDSANIREGKFSKAAFASAVRMIAKEEVSEQLFEQAGKLEGASSIVRLEAFLRVMLRHRYALFVHQLQVY